MKLYYHPISTTSRPVLFFAADEGIALDAEIVDILNGAHLQEGYAKINPNRLIPVLEDGDFRLTESSSILKYLADKTGSAAYPKELRARARVNEAMDWFNSNLYRDWAYGLVYPQLFPHLRRADETVQAGVVQWGKEQSLRWLGVLNDSLLGGDKPYLCGAEITLADYFGAPMLTAGQWVGCEFTRFPNIASWLERIAARPAWQQVNGPFYEMVASLKGGEFVRV